MSEQSDAEKSIERMKVRKELRGPRPNTMYTFARGARRFLAHVGRPPVAVTAEDVEGELTDVSRHGARKGPSPAASAATLRGA